jgi:hypothetical protein
MEIWKNLDFGSVGRKIDMDYYSLGFVALWKEALTKDNKCIFKFRRAGYLLTGNEDVDEDDEDFDEEAEAKRLALLGIERMKEAEAFFKKLGGRVIFSSGSQRWIIWDNGIMELNLSANYAEANVLSHDQKITEKIKAYFEPLWAPPPVAKPLGHIYAIIQQRGGLGMHSLGNAGIPLVEGNYMPSIIKDYKYVIKDLQSEYPSGRITVLSGTPGSGKTFLVRGMLMEVPDAMFVLISPDMVTSLSGPELLPLLMSYHSSEGPIVLVLEDADKCLVARGENNISSIQSLLNLGDGILGSMLDIRIIATTNAQKLHMEEAIMRPGRLSRMMEVEYLDRDTATGIFKRLLPTKKKLPAKLTKVEKGKTFQMTLAETYDLARKCGWSPDKRKNTAIDEDIEDDY